MAAGDASYLMAYRCSSSTPVLATWKALGEAGKLIDTGSRFVVGGSSDGKLIAVVGSSCWNSEYAASMPISSPYAATYATLFMPLVLRPRRGY
jgi:hypothetical protein